jgi:hypothetical protein
MKEQRKGLRKGLRSLKGFSSKKKCKCQKNDKGSRRKRRKRRGGEGEEEEK